MWSTGSSLQAKMESVEKKMWTYTCVHCKGPCLRFLIDFPGLKLMNDHKTWVDYYITCWVSNNCALTMPSCIPHKIMTNLL